MDFKSHPQWPALQQVYHTLNQNGYKAYLAGGCVRDALLGRVANDLDLATDATPDTVESLFTKTVAVGKAFGVILVIVDGVSIEVATFRSDGMYADGRRPDKVVFTTPEQDAQRRDFTVNALFYDLHESRVLDFVGGVDDLQAQSLKAVGNPEARFREDHLRLLRAIRFSAQLGFELESETLKATKDLASLVKSVSSERIHDETLKLLKSRNAEKGLALMASTGIGEVLFPNFSNVYQKHKKQFQQLLPTEQKDSDFVWASFLAPWAIHKDVAWEWIIDNYRFPKNSARNLKRCLEHLSQPQQFFLSPQGEQLLSLGDEGTQLFLRLAQKLGIGQSHPAMLLNKWEAWNQAMPAPWITGQDLIEKMTGKELGNQLKRAYLWQLEGRYANREELLKQILSLVS